ncbi:MAG: pentapeptide repeat-containing protein [Calothrix sp. FI2-JRJ7]|nr:pentapeptide repeat-containing protein [Calothrix sp. FI2-JRJ7]
MKFYLNNYICSPVSILIIILGIIGLQSAAVFFAVPSQAQNREVDLYNLCSKFPHNSRCKGYSIPISLEKRSGDKGECSTVFDNTKQTSSCKIVITSDRLLVYLEEGKKLDILDNERATREMVIPYNQVVSVDYLESHKDNTAAFANTGLIGALIGAPFMEHKDLSEIEISYTIQSAPGQESLNYTTITTGRKFGLTLIDKLKSLTQTRGQAQVLSELNNKGIRVGNPLHVQQLITTNKCNECDLSGAQLERANLRQANLKGSNLRGANLKGANLEKANLEGCNLFGANLEGAILRGADLTTNSKARTNLRYANLSGANLQAAKLKGANLGDAVLEGANLEDADLSIAVDKNFWTGMKTEFYTSLKDANLKGANLRSAQLDKAFLAGANLSSANLSGADLKSANLKGANLRDANLTNTNMKKTSLCGVTMPDGSISNQNCNK